MAEHTALGKRRWETTLSDIGGPLNQIRKIVGHFSKKSSKAVTGEDEELIERGLLEFLELKAANIAAHKGTEKKKMETQGKKQNVDATNLQLNNLNYEKNHYVKQIRNCRDLKLSYDKIDLLPEGDFRTAAPANLTSVDTADKPEHQLMLNRLTFELEERKRLSAELAQLKQKKSELIDANDTKSNFLSGLLSKLKRLEEATVPIQKHLGITTSRTATEYGTAYHLPRALYTLYLQAVAFRDTESVSVRIDGDVSAAIALANEEAKEVDEDAKEDDADDGDDKRDKSNDDDARKRFDAVHPLSVMVTVVSTAGDTTSTMLLRFMFMTQLNVVSVESQWEHDLASTGKLLVDLFPSDKGTQSPNPATAQLLPSQSVAWDASLRGLPFNWAQALAGLKFSADSANNGGNLPQKEQFGSVIARVKARIASHMMLQKELKALANNKLLVTEKQTADLFQMASTAAIVRWRQKDAGEVEDEDNKVYELIMQRGAYKLRAAVTLTPEYPIQAPCVELAFEAHPEPKPHVELPGIKVDPTALALAQSSEPTNNNLEAISEEINLRFDDLLMACDAGGPYNLMSLQLRRLQMCFDIYVSTELDERRKGGRICFRPERGRARKKPFEYNKSTGLFDQRR